MTDTNQLPEPDHELAELAAMRKAKKITDYKEFIAYYGKQAAYWEQRLKELDMTDTNQLPPSEREAFEAFAQNCPMGKYSITRRGDGYDSSHTQLMWDAWQARSQVQGEAFGYIHHFAAHDESGALIDTTWEADGCADPLPHPTFPAMWKWSHCAPFYTTPQPAQATQAEVTDSMIREAFLANGFTIKDGHSDLKPYVYAAARAILALRPERVPMTGEQISLEAHNADDRDWNDLRFRSSWHEGFLEGARFAEAHHGITAQAKKEDA